MKTVTLTQDLRPWRAGDEIHIEDDVAARLIENGEAKNPKPFRPAKQRSMQAGTGPQGYQTKSA